MRVTQLAAIEYCPNLTIHYEKAQGKRGLAGLTSSKGAGDCANIHRLGGICSIVSLYFRPPGAGDSPTP